MNCAILLSILDILIIVTITKGTEAFKFLDNEFFSIFNRFVNRLQDIRLEKYFFIRVIN